MRMPHYLSVEHLMVPPDGGTVSIHRLDDASLFDSVTCGHMAKDGEHFAAWPESLGEPREWFEDELDCLAALVHLQWLDDLVSRRLVPMLDETEYQSMCIGNPR